MKIGKHGLDLIKHFEGLELKAYKCQAGKWTIGYGHTGRDVFPGLVITNSRAEELLKRDVESFEREVAYLAKTPISQNQFDALVCFAFNVGSDIDLDSIPEGLGDSTLLKKVNKMDFDGAAEEFLSWNKVRVNGKLEVSKGLNRRRKAERSLFLTKGDNFNAKIY